MSLLGKIFKTRPEREAERLLRHVQAKTRAVYRPVTEVGLAIVRAAQESRERLGPVLGFSQHGEPSQTQMLVFYEFLYFFFHLAVRAALVSGLDEKQVAKLEKCLLSSLAPTAVNAVCAHWPVEIKRKMTSEFLDKLGNAQRDYATCRPLSPEVGFSHPDSLFGRLAGHVADLCEKPSDPGILLVAGPVAAEAFSRMELVRLMKDLAGVIDSVNADLWTAYDPFQAESPK